MHSCARWAMGAVVAILPAWLSAQANTKTLVVHGHVLGAGRAPVFAATVTARSALESWGDSTRTDSTGWYRVEVRLKQPDSAFSVTISVRALGYAGEHRVVHYAARGTTDVLADFQLTLVSQMLAAVDVRAARPIRPHDDAGVYGTPAGARRANINVSNGLSGEVGGDVGAALAMVDGVLPSPDGSGGLGPSAFGAGVEQNGATLNGADAGAATVPRDGPTRVVSLSTYDPRLGRFSGLQVSTTMPSGTDYRRRYLHATMEDPLLQWPVASGRGLSPQYRNDVLSGSLEGPIVPGKVFYNTALQVNRFATELTPLNTATDEVLNALGISRGSVNQLLAATSTIGLPVSARRTPSSAITTGGSALARIDLTPGAGPFISGNPDPEIYFLASGAARSSVGSGVGLTALPSRAARSTHRDGLLLFDYAPYLHRALNETKVSVLMSEDQTHGDLSVPRASVLLDSRLTNGSISVVPVQLGGSGQLQRSRLWQAEVSNDASWMTYDYRHTFDIYTEADLRHSDLSQQSNALGSFAFNSLENFAAGEPSSFARTFGGVRSSGSTWRGVVAFSDVYLAGPRAHEASFFQRANGEGIQIQYGLRADLQRFGQRPAYNPLVDSVFGRRNDRVPDGVSVSPMAGFTWNQGTEVWNMGAGTESDTRNTFSGGIREYRGALSPDNVDNVARSTGLPDAAQELECVGTAAPLADWRAIEESVSAIPTHCTNGDAPVALMQATPTVLLYARDYTSTRSWRGDISWRRALSRRFHGRLGATYALNYGGIEPFDLNFNPAQRFLLGDEGNRPVYVSPGAIASASGMFTTNESRVAPKFNRVVELRSQLRQRQAQITAGLDFSNFAGFALTQPALQWSIRASYTYAEGRRQASGFSGTTSGDPRFISWAPAIIPRHTIKLQLTGMLEGWFTVSTFAQLYSGFPYTPVVASDINGDGIANDQAFVFAPAATTDAVIAVGMENLLGTAPIQARDCLRAQLGAIARAGSCVGPWSAVLNTISVTVDPYRIGLGNRGSFSIYINNPLGGLDRLLHDDAHLRGWGQPVLPDSKLLTVRRFDPVSNRFLYTVNPQFGSHAGAVRAPFRVTLDVHVDIGPNREGESIQVYMRRAKDAAEGVPKESDVYRQLHAAQRSYGGDDFEPLGRLADEIGIDSAQMDTINRLVTRYSEAHDSIYADLSRYLAAHASAYRGAATREYWHNAIEKSIRLKYAVALKIRDLLTPAQVAALRAEGETPWIDYTPSWLRRELEQPLEPH